MSPSTIITLNSRWQGKHTSLEVTVVRVTMRTVSYIAVDRSTSGTVPSWLFLEDFQPVTECKKKQR